MDKPLRICILSRNNLTRNTRIIRLAGVLSEAGHSVTVIAAKRPMDELTRTTPKVEFLEVELDPWTRRHLMKKRKAYQELMRKPPANGGARRRLSAMLKRSASFLRHGLWHGLVLLPSAVFLRPKGTPFWPFLKELARNPYERVELFSRPLSQHANTLSFAGKAEELLGDRSFDYCQAHDTFALLAAARVAKKTGGEVGFDAIEISEHRHVESERRSPYEKLVFRFQRVQEGRLIRRTAYSIAVGDGLADWYASRYGIERPVPVRNARAFWPYAPREDIRADCELADDDSLVVWIGSMDPDQGMEVILEAARLLPDRVHFALLGPVFPRFQPFIEQVQAKAADMGLAGRVRFLPERTPLDLIPYVSGADVGIIPRIPVSLNMVHCMPNKLMEMIMARLPVAATRDLVEVRSVIERYELGEVFDVSSPDDVARVLGDMLDSAKHASYHAAAMAAADELCWENEAHKYVDIFGDARPASIPEREPVAVAQ